MLIYSSCGNTFLILCSSMEELDGDDGVLKSPLTGVKCKRDIVQFVPFNDYKRHGVKVNFILNFFILDKGICNYIDQNFIEFSVL